MLTRSALLLYRILNATFLALGALLVLLLLAEGTARIALGFLEPDERHRKRAKRSEVYFQPGRTVDEWRPHVYWRARPRRGPNVNVDADGLRVTWNAPDASEPALRVHMYGASTLRGYGARDDFTIPSLVSKILAARSPDPIVVTNFGQGAYTTTQDLLTLLFEVRNGNTPDVAVFYDGSLDVAASYEAQEAGVPRNEHRRRIAFESPMTYAKLALSKRSALAKLVLLNTPGWNPEIDRVWKSPSSPEAFPRLAEDTVRVYASNLELARALGRAYGFEVLHFWQPVVWSKDPKSAYEQRAASKIERRYPMRGELFERVYARITADSALQSDPRFHDLQDIFDGTKIDPFFDTTHTTEAGNALIAERIAPLVLDAIERRARARASVGAAGPGGDPARATASDAILAEGMGDHAQRR